MAAVVGAERLRQRAAGRASRAVAGDRRRRTQDTRPGVCGAGRALAIVGSQNQDPRSRLHNTEAWITLDSAELAGELAALFEEGADRNHAFKVERNDVDGLDKLAWSTQLDGTTVRYDSEPMSGLWLRLWRGLLGVLIPEHML